MRRLITIASLSATLLGIGGAAMASPRYETRPAVEHREVVRREVARPEIRYSNRYSRPAPVFERHEVRRGFDWVAGTWTWNGVQWIWIPGHYVRVW